MWMICSIADAHAGWNWNTTCPAVIIRAGNSWLYKVQRFETLTKPFIVPEKLMAVCTNAERSIKAPLYPWSLNPERFCVMKTHNRFYVKWSSYKCCIRYLTINILLSADSWLSFPDNFFPRRLVSTSVVLRMAWMGMEAISFARKFPVTFFISDRLVFTVSDMLMKVQKLCQTTFFVDNFLAASKQL